MAKFRKKPVVIDAFQLGGALQFIPDWALSDPRVSLHRDGATIRTDFKGDQFANPGDWIIRGVSGEVYPCRPDVFAATYEPAE